MTFARFNGTGALTASPAPTSAASGNPLHDPRGYIASPDLARAVNVSLSLQMPLLVTGEPGTGKTQLAYRVAAELGLGDVLRFDAKTSSVATDLFYQFDSVRQFAQSQLNAATKQPLPRPQEFLRLHALGKAILRTLEPAEVQRRIGIDAGHAAPVSSLVLIDEVDKAPRDFPNDLLNQIENLEFAIPELGEQVRVDRRLAPVIIITSNSEKQLPEPFLRRCVYHHIEFPKSPEELDRILGSRLSKLGLGGTGARELVLWFFRLRDDPRLAKRPSTSELLDWMRVLVQAGFDAQRGIDEQRDVLRACTGSLMKTADDVHRLRDQIATAQSLLA
jgi:MoxR-like ATPase